MDFRIADTFTESLARLTGDEQKAVKMTAFDLQLDPKSPGMKFHRLDKAKDKRFWSVRVSSDLRLIVHRTDASLLLCFVGHHDRAYDWAERRRLEVHPTTGAAQLVEIRETVKEIVVPVYVQDVRSEDRLNPAATVLGEPIFSSIDDAELLGYGVPAEWVADVRAATEDSILALIDHLPAEAAEALLELATGGRPQKPQSVLADSNPFDHPDAQRRFRVMTNVEELERALDFPWEKWTVFLHPEQQSLVERDFNGPAKVGGSAGTGKTIVALHRAAALARRNPDGRVLLTTFSDTLASALQTKLRRLLGHEPRLAERIDVHSLNSLGLRLHKAHVGPATLASREVVRQLLCESSAAEAVLKFGPHFLLTEWEQVVDAWQLDSWDAYRDVARLGRKTRLPESQRRVLWSVFERVRVELGKRKLLTQAAMFTAVAAALATSSRVVFDFAVVDECQDIGVPHLRFLAALGADRPNALFFAGDLGQRIFQQPFSWKSLGVDIRGRSKTLRVNYRTSHQIRRKADRLLGPVVTDADGNAEDRRHAVSVFNGPAPEIRTFPDEGAEAAAVAEWLVACRSEGMQPNEIGVFVRSAEQIGRARAAVDSAGLDWRVLDEHLETVGGQVSICTMHLAKGLEFRAVAVMACDDEVIPLQERIQTVGDDGDLREVYETERHLLYVACTRARDRLFVAAVEPRSEFLDDLESPERHVAARPR